MSSPAARIGDRHRCNSSNGAILEPCCKTVLIGNRPAARVDDRVGCGLIPNKIVTGAQRVFIARQKAARVGDRVNCYSEGYGFIVSGMADVLIGDLGGITTSLNDAAKLPDKTLFRAKFAEVTGMTISETLAILHAETDMGVDENVIAQLFSDRERSMELLVLYPVLHVKLREIINSKAPRSLEEALERCFTQMTIVENMFHDPMNTTKYIGPGGHLEVIIDDDNGQIVEGKHAGSFNFFGPRTETMGHIYADMGPVFL